MKTRFASVLLFSVVILASCNQAKDEQAEKIAALEEKIAALEGGNTAVNPDLAQTTTNADPSTLGAFQFTEMEFDFGTINVIINSPIDLFLYQLDLNMGTFVSPEPLELDLGTI